MNIEYCKDGNPITDFGVEDYIIFHYTRDKNIRTSSEILIDAARCLVRRGTIDYKNILFVFDGLEIRCDKFGSLEEWPKGFCDIRNNYLAELCGWSDDVKD